MLTVMPSTPALASTRRTATRLSQRRRRRDVARILQDPRFKTITSRPTGKPLDWQCFKGETPFESRFPTPTPTASSRAHRPHLPTTARRGRRHTYPARPKPAAFRLICNARGHHHLAFLHRSFEPNRQHICYTDIGMARSTDAGQTWIWWDSKSWAPWRNTCYEMAFDPDTPGKIWGAFSNVHDIPNDNIISERHGHRAPGGVCISRDFGVSWKPEAQGIPPKPVTSIVLDPRSPRNSRTLYAGVFDEGVFKSTDDGKTWTLKKAGLGHPDNRRVSRIILHGDGPLDHLREATGAGQPLMPEGVGLIAPKTARNLGKINLRTLLYPGDSSIHATAIARRRGRPRRLVRRALSHRGRRPRLATHRREGPQTRLLSSKARRLDLHDVD